MSSRARPSKADVVSDFRRRQILDAARQSFVRDGIAGTTVAGIALSAGLAKGTVYLYFKSKEEILRHLLTDDLAEFHELTVPIPEGPGSLDERLERFLRTALEFFERKRDFFELCQLEMSPDLRRKAKQKIGLVFDAQVEAWCRAFEQTARGTRSTPDLTGTARGIVCLAHGIAQHRNRGWYAGSIDDAVAWYVPLVLQGVTAP